mgnify:FL=1
MNMQMMEPIRYVDYRIYNVTKIKNKYGFRVVLILEDETEKIVQHSGFTRKDIAEKEKCKIIGKLENRTYVVYNDITVGDYMEYWFKNDGKKRMNAYNTYMAYRNAIFNQIIPRIGKVKLVDLSSIIIKKLYKEVFEYSKGVADIVRTVMVSSLKDAEVNKFVSSNVAYGINLPKEEKEKIREATEEEDTIKYHKLVIDETKTFTIEQIVTIIKASKNTPIYMNVLFASLMGLRKCETLAVKYSDIDFIKGKLNLRVQLGRKLEDDDYEDTPKTKNKKAKQEIELKSKSSIREMDIPDLVLDAIFDERKIYEKRRNRRINDKHNPFCDEGYICCSTYGKPRGRGFIHKYFKQIKEENNLPDLPFHKLRTTYSTILAKNNFSLKAIAVLLGHSSEIITFENYTDKNEIIQDCLQEMEPFMEDVLPKDNGKGRVQDCTDVEIDVIMQDAFYNIKSA